MHIVQNVSSCNKHRVQVWMLILAILTLQLILGRFVEWIVCHYCAYLMLSVGEILQKLLCRSDYAHFSRNLLRVERVTELEILAPSVRTLNEHEILVSTEAAEEGKGNYFTNTYPQMPVGRAEHISLTTRQRGPNRFRMRVDCAEHTSLTGQQPGGSACDDDRHCSGVGRDCMDGGDDSGGQSRRTSRDGYSDNGSGGLKDFDGFNDNHGFAGITVFGKPQILCALLY